MSTKNHSLTRRSFVAGAASAAASCALSQSPAAADHHDDDVALIAITLDLEMSRNFPIWEDRQWDYQKGNLTDEVKKYTLDACRRVKDRGGVIHSFAVGRVLEHASVDWLKEIAAEATRSVTTPTTMFTSWRRSWTTSNSASSELPGW